jgi:hypothetical protein
MTECENFEEKSSFAWGIEGQQFDLLKTIVAFANTSGGTIDLLMVQEPRDRLDSARLDDFVNKYVTPRLGGISSAFADEAHCLVTVQKSAFAPHVISQEASYEKSGKTKSAFYPGQVYVRHSSKSEPANGQDLHNIIREGVSSWLSALGEAVGKVGLSPSKEGGMPVRIVEGGPSIGISIGESHPYTAGDIGKKVSRTGAWIGKLCNRLNLRYDSSYCVKIPGGNTPFYRFSEKALKRIRMTLMANPHCNPYSCDGKNCKCVKIDVR